MYQLGGQALFLSSRDLQIGRGENRSKIRPGVLSRYLDGIMIRTFEQKEAEDLAKYGSIPIINGLTDYAHPCQVLADLMTVREYKGSLEGQKTLFYRRRKQHGQLPDRGMPQGRYENSRSLPEGIPPPQRMFLTLLKAKTPKNPGVFMPHNRLAPTRHRMPTQSIPTYGRAWVRKMRYKSGKKPFRVIR